MRRLLLAAGLLAALLVRADAGLVQMPISAGGPAGPTSNAAPVLSGTAAYPSTLTCTGLSTDWTPAAPPTTVQYQFFRNGSTSVQGPSGSGTSQTYAVQSADQGTTITCKEIGTNGGSTTSAASNGIAIPATAAIAHVRSFSGTANSSGTTVTFTLSAAVGSGDTLVGMFVFHNATNIISSIAAGSNTLTTADFVNYGAGGTYSAISFWLHGVTGSPTTITVTFSATPTSTDQYLMVDEYSGGSAVGVEHNYVYQAGTNTNISPSLTTGVNNSWIWSGVLVNATTPSPPGTLRVNDTTNKLYSSDLIQTTGPGSVSAPWSFSSSASNLAEIVSIRP